MSNRVPLRGLRRATAQAMSRSWAEIPHLTLMDELDAGALVALRRRLRDGPVPDATIGALLVAAVARALRRHPRLNSSLDAAAGGASIVLHGERNVGVAVATAEGLVVPVVRRADERPLPDLAAEVRRVTLAARERRLTPADLAGGTFTVSNYGALAGRAGAGGAGVVGGAGGARFATPIIRPPEAAVMGFGQVAWRPFVGPGGLGPDGAATPGRLRARPTLPWSLSVDHRLVDGDVAGAFAADVAGLLAEPTALLLELLLGDGGGPSASGPGAAG